MTELYKDRSITYIALLTNLVYEQSFNPREADIHYKTFLSIKIKCKLCCFFSIELYILLKRKY